MGRGLKFRGWDREKGIWLFGYDRCGGFSLIGEVVFFGELTKYSLPYYNNIIFTTYTGVNDKFGKEIYEGDIITYDGKYFEEVKWMEDPLFQGYNIDIKNSKLEVAGHIFLKPNLLTIQHEQKIQYLLSKISKRDKDIVDSFQNGIKQSQISIKHKISNTRVRQILSKWRYLLPMTK